MQLILDSDTLIKMSKLEEKIISDNNDEKCAITEVDKGGDVSLSNKENVQEKENILLNGKESVNISTEKENSVELSLKVVTNDVGKECETQEEILDNSDTDVVSEGVSQSKMDVIPEINSEIETAEVASEKVTQKSNVISGETSKIVKSANAASEEVTQNQIDLNPEKTMEMFETAKDLKQNEVDTIPKLNSITDISTENVTEDVVAGVDKISNNVEPGPEELENRNDTTMDTKMEPVSSKELSNIESMERNTDLLEVNGNFIEENADYFKKITVCVKDPNDVKENNDVNEINNERNDSTEFPKIKDEPDQLESSVGSLIKSSENTQNGNERIEITREGDNCEIAADIKLGQQDQESSLEKSNGEIKTEIKSETLDNIKQDTENTEQIDSNDKEAATNHEEGIKVYEEKELESGYKSGVTSTKNEITKQKDKAQNLEINHVENSISKDENDENATVTLEETKDCQIMSDLTTSVNVESASTHTNEINNRLSVDSTEDDSINNVQIEESSVRISETKKPKVKPTQILKLSNTLDILSDDEDDDCPKEVKELKPQNVTEKKNNVETSINIDDDDDVMVIDEDSCSKEVQNESNNVETETEQMEVDLKVDGDTTHEEIRKQDKTQPEESNITEVSDLEEIRRDTTEAVIESNIEENPIQEPIKTSEKPFIADNFFKTCKKNLAQMTRDDLEEFCVLKIVECVVDRSNLSEIKTKLKIMAQSIEEHKKKVQTLNKQNRDLQVVLKSVQEEQKKSETKPIMPLKITRSVGMQVLMTDKGPVTLRKRAPANNAQSSINNNTVNAVNRPVRSTVNQNLRQQKPPNTSQQNIPVPKLVPANNLAPKGPATNSVANPVTNKTSLPNGVKNSPQKPVEKRLRLQSVTVDLTDDEPPAKLPSRATSVPPVRMVPTQNLMPPRLLNNSTSNPRKVYIPISGPQTASSRPGAMLKVSPSAVRQRGPSNQAIRMQQNSIRMSRILSNTSRHPAPLPEVVKQYQPPNWKALPPAPDLKLSKVENGIVISWKIEGYQDDSYEEIACYQLYAYQETTAPPSTALWKKIGDVKALPLPMACTLTQFLAGFKYYFAVRAVDVRSRLGPFSLPGSILLINKNI